MDLIIEYKKKANIVMLSSVLPLTVIIYFPIVYALYLFGGTISNVNLISYIGIIISIISANVLSRYIKKYYLRKQIIKNINGDLIKYIEELIALNKYDKALNKMKYIYEIVDDKLTNKELKNINYCYALIKFENNKINEALLYINKYILYQKNNPEAYFIRGKIYYIKQIFDKSEEDFNIATSINPEYSKIISGFKKQIVNNNNEI